MEHFRHLRVVVASPSDLNEERDRVARVAEDVNRTFRLYRLFLEVQRWETDARPGFHPDGPQGLVDLALKIEECDLLIGILWRRFGTRVSDAGSGTEHEFRLAYKTWKEKRRPEIKFYFCQRPYFPESVEETRQQGLVIEFKNNFPGEGLWWTYRDADEFERLMRRHLADFLIWQAELDKTPPMAPGQDSKG